MGSNGSNGRVSIRAPNPPIEDSVFKQFRLDGRTVIITGGAGGIGYEIARGLAEAGANVRLPAEFACSFFCSVSLMIDITNSQLALWYKASTKAEELAATITKDFGVKVQAYKVDVQNYDAVEKAVDLVVQDFGRLDVMIANAGIPTKAGGLDDKIEDWNRVRAIDFDGAYYSLRAAGLVFRKQGHGVGIATASMSGHAANVPQEQSCYNACKAGVVSVCARRVLLAADSGLLTCKTLFRFTCVNLCPWSGPNGEVASTLFPRVTSIQRSQQIVHSR